MATRDTSAALTGISDIDDGPISPPPPPPRNAKRRTNTTKKSQHAAQIAKQELRSKLREDWAWSSASSMQSSHQAINLPTDESAWQERGDGFETDLSPEEAIATDPYQYENPDAVTASTQVTGRAESRKRKRQQVFFEEMGWNEGLRHFVEQRDVWSGARECQLDPANMAKSGLGSGVFAGGAGGRVVPRKRNEIYAPPTAMNGFQYDPAERPFDLPSLPSPYQQLPKMTLVPIAPPILPPGNSVRASITPATYPSIYSKIVIQGLTPTVPINLHDVVGALVKGWKDNDEWPPKSDAERATTAEGALGLEGFGESMSSGMKNGVRRKVGKVKRALHLSGTMEGDNDRSREVGVDEALEISKTLLKNILDEEEVL